jgi:hypothetical protein
MEKELQRDEKSRKSGPFVSNTGAITDIKTKGSPNFTDESDYNIYRDSCKLMQDYIDNVFTIGHFSNLKNHYLRCKTFGKHPCMELIMKIYALIRNLESSQEFKGYMKKRKEEMKENYYKLPLVGGLCTQEELAHFKSHDRRNKGPIVEEVTIFCFINEVCRSVEIINNNDENCLAFYPLLPKVFFLSSQSINSFREEARIDQSTAKLMDLMSYCEQFEIEMDLNFKMSQNHYLISMILAEDALRMYKQVLWVAGFAINVIVLYKYEIFEGDLVIRDQFAALVLHYLSLGVGGASFLILLLWSWFIYPSIRSIEREKFEINDPGIDPDSLANWITISVVYSIFYQDACMNFIMHLLFVVLSIYASPVFFSLHLLLIINILKTAKYVVKSITYRFPQLCMTFALAVMMIYAYSILQVDYFRRQFGPEYPPTMCNTIFSCFAYSLNLGLRNGGGMGDSMQLMTLDDPKFAGKQVFDISYFMLINIVSLNIIFGIIIDTFAELRDAQNTRDEDYLNVCFICGHSRESFEKEGLSFDKHTKFEHNPTNYINFLIYLSEKPKDTFDGSEEYVYTQWQKNKTQWFPIQDTRYIQTDDPDDSDQKIENVCEAFQKVDSEACEFLEEFQGLRQAVWKVGLRIDALEKNTKTIKRRAVGWDAEHVGKVAGRMGDAGNRTAPVCGDTPSPGDRM